MSEEVSLDFELTKDNKKALEELLKASGIRHFIIETKDYGNIDVVEYKEYLKLKEVLDKIKEIMGADLSNMEKLVAINIMLKKDELLEEIE